MVESEPVVVQADRIRLERVLDKLLDNAVRYSPRGGLIEVSVSVRDGRGARVRAATTASASRREAGPHFERFYRAHTDTLHDYGGMGVGLYIFARDYRAARRQDVVLSEGGEGAVLLQLLP